MEIEITMNLALKMTPEVIETLEVIAPRWGCEQTMEAVLAQVRTSHVFPPIPIRSCDWAAFFDGLEEGPLGRGATEAAAITDLLFTAECLWS